MLLIAVVLAGSLSIPEVFILDCAELAADATADKLAIMGSMASMYDFTEVSLYDAIFLLSLARIHLILGEVNLDIKKKTIPLPF